MKKILQIGMASSLGGIEVFLKNLYDNINHEEFQFDFIDTTPNGICYKEYFERSGCKVYKVTSRRENMLKNKKELENIIKNNHYDIIHYHLNTLSYITPIILANKYNIKVIVHSHNEWKGTNLRTAILDQINKKRIIKENVVRLACSEVAGNWIFGKEPYKIIDNGINTLEFLYKKEKREKVRTELNIPESCTIIGHVGAFRYQKNHNFIIDVYYEYLKRNRNSMLILVGEGELKEEIETKVKDLQIEKNVKFLGLRKDVNNILSAMDYFIFPSHFEGLPISLVEAQIAGLPCLVSDTITREIDLTGKIDFISITENDIEKWVQKIINTKTGNREISLDNPKIKKYDIRNTVNQIENIYST